MKSGNQFPAQLSSVPVYDADEAGTMYRTAIIDITERRHAEERILRLNRLYLVLSETGKAIVRATDRDELFRNICRIVVRHGGFRMAWVGLVDAESGLVQPGDGERSGCRLPAQHPHLGQGGTGRAGAYRFRHPRRELLRLQRLRKRSAHCSLA